MDELELDPFALEHHGAQSGASVQLVQAGQEVFVFGVQVLLTLAVDGYPRAIRSTLARRNELLRWHGGDAKSSAATAVESQEEYLTEARDFLIRLIPSLGMPLTILYPLWRNVRSLLLVAGLFGHDLHDEMVQSRVICAAAGLQTAPKADKTLERALEFLWRKLAGSLAKLVPASHIVQTDVENKAMAFFIEHFSDGPGASEADYMLELDPEVSLDDFMELLREMGAQTLEQLQERLQEL